MTQNLLFSFGLAGIVRLFLISSNFADSIRNRIEVTTPLNSWKKSKFCVFRSSKWLTNQFILNFSVKEGAFLYEHGINPYSGDLYHENPLILFISNFLIRNTSPFIPYLFVGGDLLCAFLLHRMSKNLIAQLVSSVHIRKVQLSE